MSVIVTRSCDIIRHDTNHEAIVDIKRKKIPRLGPFLLLKTLGVGEFGKVKMGKHIETDQKVAVKLVRKDHIDSPSQLEKIRMEIEILRTLNHPYIVKLLTVNETDACIGIVLEYAEGGELFEYIYRQKYLQEAEARRLFAQLVSSIYYMHEKNIVHRDLKLENILLDAQGNLIVTDFGFANQFSPITGDLMSTSCGSPCYAAPELVMTGNLYSGRATDIWSSGVILYAMLCGYLPFDDDIKNPNDNVGRLYRYIMVNKPKYPHRLSDDAKDIIGKMLVPDPSKRSKIEEIMAHPWLYEYADLFSKSIEELEMEAQLVKQILLRHTLSPEPSYENSEYCSSCCESRVSDTSSSSSSLASSSYSYKAKNEINIGTIQEPTEKVNIEDPIKDDLQEEEQISQQQKDQVIDSSDDGLAISQTSKKKEHESIEIVEEYQIKQEDEIEDEIIPIAPIRHDNNSVHAAQVLPANDQTGVTAPYLESEDLSVQKQSPLNKPSNTNVKSSVQIEQTSNKPNTGNTSLKAKFFSSVRIRPQKQSKTTKQDKKNDVNKEKTSKPKNKRNSWQALMHHDHSVEAPAPIPQQTKSTGFISWLKNKAHHKNKHCDTSRDVSSSLIPNYSGSVSSKSVTPSTFTDLRVYTGALNQSALTSKSPMEALLEITKILIILGIDVENDGGYKLICTRRASSSAAIYGHSEIDSGEQVQFVIEICSLKDVFGLFCIDIQPLNSDNVYQFIGQKLLDLLHLGGTMKGAGYHEAILQYNVSSSK
ncbi:hypothetical protein G6F68_003087 [Rhizopus microsporus]|nr:hypothetical protein G6F67_003931 [Rhizopus microsporus]KAG1266041.1 hypothetical protein G6F68_003087 [Rhizopus microsporus]